MIAGAKPALIISECQRGIVDPELSRTPQIAREVVRRGILDRIATLADAFRATGHPVVHCTIGHRPDLGGLIPNSLLGAMTIKHRSMIAGTPEAEEPEPVAPHPSDFVSSRATGITAFYGTDLDAILRPLRVDTLVLTGVSTNVALPGLAMEAVNRGYYVVLPEDATAGTSEDAHRFMVDNLLRITARVTTTEEVVTGLQEPAG